MQPIKKNLNYNNFLSKELCDILNNITNKDNITNNICTEITPEFFIYYCTSDEQCVLYKVLSTFLNSISILNIKNVLSDKMDLKSLTPLQNNDTTVKYSSLFNLFLGKANEERELLEHNYITSDHILLAIINEKQNNWIKGLFEKYGINYEKLQSLSSSFHETLDDVNINEQQVVKIRVIGDTKNISKEDLQEIQNILFKQNINKTKQSTKKSNVKFCTHLNVLAKDGKISKVIDRNKEINEIERVFARKKNNNVIIVGENGVGKTSIVNAIALLSNDENNNTLFRNCNVYRLNISEIIGGTTLRGMFEDRVNTILNDLSKVDNPIMFIDDIHTITSTNKHEEYNILGLISEALLTNDIKFILSTTPKGYKTMLDDNVISNNFKKITIDPLSVDDTTKILNECKLEYEDYHGVIYSDDVINKCAELCNRYIPEQKLPSSAIDILDEMGAERRIKINKLGGGYVTINIDSLYSAISSRTGIPLSKINATEIKTLSNIDKTIKNVVIGQDEAINDIATAIKINKLGLIKRDKPIYSCICIGNTGCGKTLMAKTLAKEVFGDEKYLVRFDMSEYSDKTSVNKLIGSSAGYIGYEKGGLLTEAIRNKKYAVLLIDEIEKATDEVFNLFLQIFDDGFLTDNIGNKVDFKNTIIILTSNVGAKKASTTKGIGFNVDNSNIKKEVLQQELKKKFSPEFINRLDDVIIFNDLTDDNLLKIIDIELNKVCEHLKTLGYNVTYNDCVKNYILKTIEKEREYGARPINRSIQTNIINNICDKLFNCSENKDFYFDVIDNKLVLS